MSKLTALAVACLMGLTMVNAQEAEEPQPQLPPKAQKQNAIQRKKRNPEQRRQKMAAKRAERMNQKAADLLAAYDTDKDGKLNQTEKETMLKAFDKAKATMAMARTYQVLQKMDADGDLVITPEEATAGFEAMKEARAQGRKGKARKE